MNARNIRSSAAMLVWPGVVLAITLLRPQRSGLSELAAYPFICVALLFATLALGVSLLLPLRMVRLYATPIKIVATVLGVGLIAAGTMGSNVLAGAAALPFFMVVLMVGREMSVRD